MHWLVEAVWNQCELINTSPHHAHVSVIMQRELWLTWGPSPAHPGSMASLCHGHSLLSPVSPQ